MGVNVRDEVVGETHAGDIVLILRPDFGEAVRELADLEGFNDVGTFVLWFLSLWGGQLAKHKWGNEVLGERLMDANVKRWPAA